jgi:hypothetical protein
VTLKLLLENTEEASVVDTPDTLMGATPLMLAAAAGHSACVRSAIFLVSISVADPWHFGVDPDPAIFVIDLQDAPKKKKKEFCLLLFEGTPLHLHNT